MSGQPRRDDDLLTAGEAAELLGVSRRTLDRLMARGEVERVAGADGKTYVTRQSALACQRARQNPVRRRIQAPDAVALLEAVERLVQALREEREATLTALAEREAARVELAAAHAELRLLRNAARLQLSAAPPDSARAPVDVVDAELLAEPAAAAAADDELGQGAVAELA